jgi:cytoskeletal protein CcmA (bactofilin family)
MAETENTPSNDALSEPNSLETADDTNVSLESIGSGQPNVNPEHNSTELASEASSPPPTKEPDKKSKRFRRLRQRFNIPILLFGLVILIAFGIVIVAYLQSKKSSTSHAQTQSLSQSTLEQLANSDATVGNNQSILNVESSAVFAGQVLVRQNLQVAGNLQIGGTLALSNIAVAGTSQLGQATVNKNLAVAGDTAIQGSATIAKSLQVSSSGTFGGSLSAPQIVTSSLQLNGDLVLTHHISVGGSTPSRTTDTAGAISINTGGGPAAGCFVTINFTASYTNTPFVQITPIGSSAGGLSYYVNRSATSFSVCDTSPPPAGASFGFDYFVVE